MNISFAGRIPTPSIGTIGMEGEHNAETLYFRGLPEIDGGTAALNVVLPNGTADVLTITDGDIMVRTSGHNAEGIESKGTLTISGGDVLVSAYDDAINSSGDLTISDGYVLCVGTNNDGIDTNGNFYIKGGTLIAMGASGAETGIDIDEQHKFYISGGNFFGIGERIDGTIGSTTQGIVTTTGSVQANSTVTISSGSTSLASFSMPPYSYNNGTIIVSAPGMTSGSSYTLSLGSSTLTVTASNSINSGMGGMGGQPGGGWGR